MHLPFQTLRPTSPRREEGFTILEAMIALLLTSLVVGMAYASYAFLSRFVTRWQGQMTLENTVHRVLRDVTRRAHWADAVHEEEGGWVLVSQDGSEVTYQHSDGTLLRNGQPMHGDGVDIVEMSLTVVAPSESSQAEEPEAFWADEEEVDEEEVAWRRPHLRLRLTAATARDTLALGTAVYLRQPEGWSASGENNEASQFPTDPMPSGPEFDR